MFLNSILPNFFVKEILFELRMTIKKRDGPRRLTSISAVTGKNLKNSGFDGIRTRAIQILVVDV